MAKKKTNNTSYNKLAGILALISIFITGIIYMINAVLKWFNVSFNGGILMLIANLFMLLAITLISYKALKGLHLPYKKVWYILYFVFVILAFVGQLALL